LDKAVGIADNHMAWIGTKTTHPLTIVHDARDARTKEIHVYPISLTESICCEVEELTIIV
jgi:hypothetical protein